MIIAIVCAVATMFGFVIGWVLADNYFWNRQDWASRVEGRL